jgi:protein-serine/threonine kinase
VFRNDGLVFAKSSKEELIGLISSLQDEVKSIRIQASTLGQGPLDGMAKKIEVLAESHKKAQHSVSLSNSPASPASASFGGACGQIEDRLAYTSPHMNPQSPKVSPAASTASTANQSDHRNGDQITLPVEETANLAVDGKAVPPKRSTMTSHLSRMFSSPGPKHKDQSDSRSRSLDRKPDPIGAVKAPPNPATSFRQPSYDQKDGKETNNRKFSMLGGSKEKANEPGGPNSAATQRKRFEIQEDGTHTHHLNSAKRQEKLPSSMLGGGKKKDANSGDPNQPLSLMSSWVDQLKFEPETLASDKKGGPNAIAGLVEKYGKCQEIVGRAAFSIVRISHKPDPKDAKAELLYAVKEFRKPPRETSTKYSKRLTSEFCISSSLQHPNIIHTLDLLQDAKGDYCEVMEYCAGGDLRTLIQSAGNLQGLEADCFFKQLMRGVEYMHEMGVAHRDLKPENLLLTTHGALKITEFGNGECFRMAWEKEAHMTTGLCGSAPYIAPEEYGGGEFDPRAVDVWACGVIYMAMRIGRHLWMVARKDEDDFYERYLEGRRNEDGYPPIETLHRVSRFYISLPRLILT